MIKHINDSDSNRWQVIDLDTGKKIKGCQWADDEKGIYETIILNNDDLFVRKIKKGNIKLIENKNCYISSYMRGHEIEFRNGNWYYCDNGELANYDRPCIRCNKMPTKEGYDACIGFIDSAISACCGHGIEKSYIRLKGDKND